MRFAFSRWPAITHVGAWFMLFVVALTGGCVVGPDYHPPSPPAVASYTVSPQPTRISATDDVTSGTAQRLSTQEAVTAHWWTLFHSDALNHLVSVALDASPTLMQARAKLEQAGEDYRGQAGGTQYPRVDATLSATREKLDLQSFGLTSVPKAGPFTLYNAAVAVSYSLDLFGSNRRELEALRAQVDYQRFEWEAARLSLAGNVVTAAIREASLRERIDIIQRLIVAQEQQLTIALGRYRLGGVALLDVKTEQAQAAQIRASLPPLRKDLSQTRHQLAVYLGQPPSGDASIPAIHLRDLQLPALLPLSLPSSLARQRPDIRAAEALLHLASANVGIATANLYPKITLSASLGSQALTAGQVFGGGAGVWNAGASLLQPIFHGGELRARRRSAIAAYAQASAAYQQVVLQGLQNVADVMRALQSDADTLHELADASAQASESYRITLDRRNTGGVSELALLDARREYLISSLQQVQAGADRYADSAALLQALGGGLSNEGPIDSVRRKTRQE
jgi:NodT family efflux transporter outer membrane factor (OMF) lipoprotein